MNPLLLLPLQTKTYNNIILTQANDLSNLINKAIIKDKNYIIFNKFIYPTNRIILNQKGYFIEKYNNDYIIFWNDFDNNIHE